MKILKQNLIFRNHIQKLIRSFFVLLVFLYSGHCFSQKQTKDDLNQEKIRIDKEIKSTNIKLEKEKEKKESALILFDESQYKIQNQKKKLYDLDLELKNIETSISQSKKKIENSRKSIELNKIELRSIKEQYSKLIYQSYLWKNTYNESYFLLSSQNLNQLYKRNKFLEELIFARSKRIMLIQKKTREIESEQKRLISNKDTLILEKITQEKILFEQEKEKDNLENEKTRNLEIINVIKKNEKFYQDLISQKIQESKDIENQIKKIIEEEIRRSRENARKNPTESPLTPEYLELSKNFTNNKGKLPWPLEKGVIVGQYGKQKHPALSGVEIVNNGIDISTDFGQDVRSVFDGNVSRIFFIKGKGKAVLINHGGYFTVYSALQDVIVKTGEKVFSKQKIGTIAKNQEDLYPQLHFEIWKDKETQNPSKWLYKAY